MTGTPEGSTESGFMEKPGIEPETPGLQGIALIHYTTGAYSISFCYMNCKINRKIHKYKVHLKKEQVSQYMHINFKVIFKECLSR